MAEFKKSFRELEPDFVKLKSDVRVVEQHNNPGVYNYELFAPDDKGKLKFVIVLSSDTFNKLFNH